MRRPEVRINPDNPSEVLIEQDSDAIVVPASHLPALMEDLRHACRKAIASIIAAPSGSR